ncbi:LOW QUALITY PROTEIN: diacylglycerol O-acyltransferase 1 [Spheniscus humboldti]
MPQPVACDTEIRHRRAESLSCPSLCESLLLCRSGFSNFQGIFNHCVVLLVLTLIHITLESFIKHGLLFDPIKFILVFMKHPCKWPAIYLIAASLLLVLPAVFIERYLKKVRGAESIGLVLQPLNSFTVTFPAVMVCRVKAVTPIGGLLTLFVYLIVTLKLFSYYQVNERRLIRSAEHSSHCSRKNERGPSEQITYPVNLKVKHLYYFLLAPTLCYHLNFPRNSHCRHSCIIKRLLEVEIEFALLTEYVLKLAANHFIWLIFFYWYFRSRLNCLAELLWSGDWQFYLDWCIPIQGDGSVKKVLNVDIVVLLYMKNENQLHMQQATQQGRVQARPAPLPARGGGDSETFSPVLCSAATALNVRRRSGVPSARWNTPAHRWLDRHVCKPLLHQGYDKWQARLAAFLLSACFCEYLIAISLKMFRFGMFTAMPSQSQRVRPELEGFCNQPREGGPGHPLRSEPATYLKASEHCLGADVPSVTIRQTAMISECKTCGHLSHCPACGNGFLMAATVTRSCGISLVLGPPLTVLLYFQDYYIIHCKDSAWRLFVL